MNATNLQSLRDMLALAQEHGYPAVIVSDRLFVQIHLTFPGFETKMFHEEFNAAELSDLQELISTGYN